VWPFAFFLVFPILWELSSPFEIPILCAIAALGVWGSVTGCAWVRILTGTILICILFGGGCAYAGVRRNLIFDYRAYEGSFAEGVAAMFDALVPYQPYILFAAAGLFSMAVSPSQSPTTVKAQPDSRDEPPPSASI
jgi:hypothetical protein